MKKFALRGIIFLMLFLIFISIMQEIADRGFQKNSLESYKEWNDIISGDVNSDLIIQGSSRAVFHISPYILDSALNFDSYNIGIDGWNFHMQYYRFLVYMQFNKKPKYILQNVDALTLKRNANLFNYAQFLPYLDIDLIREAVSPYPSLDWRDFYIPMYKYHGNYSLYCTGFQNNFQQPLADNGRYKGFEARGLLWDSSFRQFTKTVPNGWRINVDEHTNDLFEKFLDLCRAKKIKVIFVYTPEYMEAQKILLNRDSITAIFKNYASKYNIPFLDYSNDSICLDTINFYNSQHLNAVGVRKFNHKLAIDLKELLITY